ncbi:MAG: N-acetyldiaminopimelate deacetylase, partial [Candidatus Cloacimonetes bacterium]|nr:N-acetyldiaminopimelate deacetylase [Candidatus Cloacimonadota bacterium]
ESINFIEAETVMTGEDFGFLTSRYPGLLFWLGAGNNSGRLHSDKFLPDSRCIEIGVKAFASLINKK